MNKYIKTIALIFVFASCNPNKDSNVFDSNKLVGKYKVDITPFIAAAVDKTKDQDNDASKIGMGLAALALSSIKIEMDFYENQKGVMSIDGGIIDIANAFADKPVPKVNEFSYKVENDSILYIKGHDDKEFRHWAIVRKFSEKYDYLQFLMIEDENNKVYGNNKVFFNLTKVIE